MAQDIVIAGATFNAVPSIEIPTAQGGTAKFVDPSPTTAGAADVASGKLFFDALGALVQGTASGGGGGLDYETGTWEPAEDINKHTISFSKTHTERPIFVMLVDVENTSIPTNSNFLLTVTNWYDCFGAAPTSGNGTNHYGRVTYGYRTTSTPSYGVTSCTGITSTTSSSDIPYWISPTGFLAYAISSSRYWRAGRTYKWIAVWKPST